jgi:hypothetical protein
VRRTSRKLAPRLGSNHVELPFTRQTSGTLIRRWATSHPITSQGQYKKRPVALFLLAFFLVVALAVRANGPKTNDAVDKAAALKAETAWLALLDKPDFVAAGAGVSEESLAGIPNQTPDEKAHTMGALLASIGTHQPHGRAT